jgi:hypothetical protein
MEGGGASCLEPGVIVADDELDAPHAAGEGTLEEGPPVVLRLAELDTASEDGPLAVGRDADGDENGTGDDGPAVADRLVPASTMRSVISPVGGLRQAVSCSSSSAGPG